MSVMRDDKTIGNASSSCKLSMQEIQKSED